MENDVDGIVHGPVGSVSELQGVQDPATGVQTYGPCFLGESDDDGGLQADW